MSYCHGKGKPDMCSLLGGCPFLGRSFIGGSNVVSLCMFTLWCYHTKSDIFINLEDLNNKLALIKGALSWKLVNRGRV